MEYSPVCNGFLEAKELPEIAKGDGAPNAVVLSCRADVLAVSSVLDHVEQRANAVAPGFILTDMTKALGEETLKQFVSMIPMRRGGEPQEVAKVALFLASDLSSYVSGQVIQVNGAMV